MTKAWNQAHEVSTVLKSGVGRMNPDRARRMGKGRFGRLLGFWMLAWLALASAPAAWGAIRYVKADSTGANTGASWANAYPSLQTALAAAQSRDEIWVAAGTYKPTTGTDQSIYFRMIDGVAIYGGFAGTETARGQRNWSTHATVLSGDIGTIGTASDNTYHVVVGANGAVLDGFTITGGYANGNNGNSYAGGGIINDSVSPTIANCTFANNAASGINHRGGGMYNTNSSPTVTNCSFTNNTAADSLGDESYGGGMCNDNSSPTVTNCTFANNTAIASYAGYGGGMYTYGASPIVTNCTFTNNTVSGPYSYGGGMCNYGASPTVKNCTFTNNTAAGNMVFGGGMCNSDNASPTVTNCTFTNNTANGDGYGGGIFTVDPSSPTLTNCIFWNNSAPQGSEIYNASGTLTFKKYCDIQGCGGSGAGWDTTLGTDGGGNIDADPLFANASTPAGTDGVWLTADDGLRLRFGSPCINAGTTDGASTTDILGNARDSRPDIGAYEYQIPAPTVTSAASLTRNAKPTWTWTSGGGNGMFRYQLDSTDSNGWTVNQATSFTPLTALADGTHVLYVKELDDAGHMSSAGSYAVTVDTTPPGAPVVTATLTTPLRPAWRWTSGGGGNGTFQYQFDSTGGAWTTTTDTRYASTKDLSLGAHALYVRERDDAGNWSAIGSASIAAINAAQDWRGYR
jgi:hypothetical protein